MHRTEFVVEGKADFPLDMLRVDECHPLFGPPLEERVVLVHFDRCPDWSPTHERWRSFGWNVTETGTTQPHTDPIIELLMEAREAIQYGTNPSGLLDRIHQATR